MALLGLVTEGIQLFYLRCIDQLQQIFILTQGPYELNII